MRLNEPVTNHEIEFPDGEPLVSKTDLDGRIVFANKVFVEVSGYPLDELIGEPHNLVRHPDMPKEAFADLWATIKAGRPWEGLVKNRTKQGNFYWVRANVTPVVEQGEVTGYISIRAKPTRQQIGEADMAYRSIRAGNGGDLGLRDGTLIRRGLRERLGTVFASVTGRLAMTGLVCALIIVIVGWLGLQGMSASNAALQSVYQGSAVETARITSIRAAMRGNVQLVTLLALELRGDKTASTEKNTAAISANSEHIDQMLTDYMRSGLSPAQAELARTFNEQRQAFVRDGLKPAITLAEHGDAAGLDRLLHAQVVPLFEAAATTNNKLVDLQVKQAEAAYNDAMIDFRFRFLAATATMACRRPCSYRARSNLAANPQAPLASVGR